MFEEPQIHEAQRVSDRMVELETAQVQELFDRFRQGIREDGAMSAAPQTVGERLAVHLWWAMIAGPEAEAETWKSALREYGLQMDQRELVRRCYYEQMRSRITDEQLAQLRRHFREGLD